MINKLVHRIALPYFRSAPVFTMAEQKAKKAASPPADKKPQPPTPGSTEANAQPEEPAVISMEDMTPVYGFYRNVIKDINKRGKSERGKFHEETLNIIIKRSQVKDLSLLFEAYFNFLGHFTLISNRTVDSLIAKAIQLASEDTEKAEEALGKVIDIFKNHEYLNYFPHYNTTMLAATFAAKHNQLDKLTRALRYKLLVKLNAQTVEHLFALSADWKGCLALIKMLCFRHNNHLLPDLPKERLLELIVTRVKNLEEIPQFREHNDFKNFLRSFDKPTADLAIAWVVATKQFHEIASVLKQVDSKDENLAVVVEALSNLQLEEGRNFRQQFKELLQGSAHTHLFD